MRLELTNVGVLGPGKTIIDLQPGINAVVGENGTGKSTIANALYFAVTGATISGINLDELITWGCPSMTVKLIGEDFVIERSLNTSGTSKAYFQRGNGEKITRKAEIDQAVCNMFGILDKSVFKLVYFAEQFRAIDFIDATDSERISSLMAVFGFSQLEKIRAELQKHIFDLNIAKVDDSLMKNLEEAIVNVQKELNEAVNQQNVELTKQRTPEQLAELNRIVSSIPENTKVNLLSDIQANQFILENLNKRLLALPKPPTDEETALYWKLMNSKSVEDNRAKLTSELAGLGDDPGLTSESLDQYAENIKDQRRTVEGEINDLTKRKTIMADGKCPLTGGVPCPDLLSLTDVKTIEADISKLTSNLSQLNKDLTEVTQMAVNVRKYETDKARIEAQLKMLPPKFECDLDVTDYEQRKEQAKQAENVFTEINQEIVKTNSQLSVLQAEYEKVKDAVEASPADIEKATKEIQEATTADAVLQVINNKITDAQQRLADSVASKSLADTQNATAEENIEVKNILNKVRQAFHRDNVPKTLIGELLEVLNYQLDKQLATFEFPYKVVWISGGSLMYYTNDGALHPVSRLSGGQKYVLVIAIRQCLATLLSTRFPLLVLDEPTTGLDVKNREALSATLQRLVKEYKDIYLLIPTHDPKLLPDANIIKL